VRQAADFVELANDVNDHMPDYVVRRLAMAFNEHSLSVKGRRWSARQPRSAR